MKKNIKADLVPDLTTERKIKIEDLKIEKKRVEAILKTTEKKKKFWKKIQRQRKRKNQLENRRRC